MTRSNRHRWGAITAGLVVMAAVSLTGCSDDDAESADETDTTSPTAEVTTFCDNVLTADRYFQTLQGPPDQAEAEGVLASVVDNAPDELADTVQTVADETRASLESGGETTEEFEAAYDEVQSWMRDNCGWPTVDVTAVDYAYEGVPETVEAGKTAFTFTNDGTEVHEMQLVRINDGVTESLAEIAALPEDEALSKVTPLGGAFAEPGSTSPATADLSEPGRYGVLCFIPQGTTPDKLAELEASDTPPEGAPHFTLGMVQEFEVG